MTLSPVPVENFGGLNLTEDPGTVGWDGVTDLLNVELDQRGRVRSRDGYAKLTAAAGATRYDAVGAVAQGNTLSSSTATATTTVNDATIGTTAWATVASGAVADGVSATITNTSASVASQYLKATGFGFAIPAGATINGITVSLLGKIDFRYFDGTALKIVKAGTPSGTDGGAPTFRNTGFEWRSGGSSTANWWSTALTPADINGANFGAVYGVTSAGVPSGSPTDPGNMFIDSFRITIYYTVANTAYVLASSTAARIDAINADGSVATTVATVGDTGPSTFANFGSPSTTATYIANSGTTVRKYSGAAFSAPAGMPKAKHIALQSPDNRLFASNVNVIPTGAASTASTSLVHMSGAGTPETWGANDFVYLTPGDGQDIQGMARWREQILVFKSTKYFAFYGNSTDGSGNPVFNYRPIDTGIGLVGPLALASSPFGMFFVDKRGVYLTTGGPPERVSQAIDPIFVGGSVPFYNGGVINQAAWAQVALCWHADRLYMGYPSGSSTVNDRTLVYDPQSKTWTLWDIPMGAMVTLASQPGRLIFTYATGTNDLGQYAPNAYTDDAGTAITSLYRSGFSDLGATETKDIREWLLEGSGSPTFKVSDDFGSLDPGATVALGTAPAVAEGRRRYAARGRQFSWQVGASTAWSLNNLVARVREKRAPGTHS